MKTADLTARFEELSAVLPDVFSALLILVGGVLVAFSFKKLILYFFRRLSRSNNVRIAKVAKSGYITGFVSAVSNLIFWSALIIAGSMVLQLFGVNVLDEWMKRITEFLPSVFGAFLVVVTGFLIAKLCRDFLLETASFASIGIKQSVPSVLYYTICSVTILIAVEQLGIDIGFLTSALLVFLLCTLAGGAISFGIGSAPIVTNLLSTYYIKKRIKVGQYLTSSDLSGTVVEIGPTCVFIKSEQGIESVPSKQLNELRIVVKNAGN